MSGITRMFSVVGKNDDNTGLHVAFASDDGETVNQHFGTAHSFVTYSISPERIALVSVAEFKKLGDGYPDDKLATKLDYLKDCVAVYCRACGASGIKKLLEEQIQPLKVTEDISIKKLIKAFQQELKEGPSSWLERAIDRQKSQAESYFKNLEGEKHV